MKSFLLLVTIGLALATPFEGEVSVEEEVIPSKHYPEVITDIDQVDISKLSIEELLEEAGHHPGLEFLNDADAVASMGIDPMNIDPELIVDAFSTTVR